MGKKRKQGQSPPVTINANEQVKNKKIKFEETDQTKSKIEECTSSKNKELKFKNKIISPAVQANIVKNGIIAEESNVDECTGNRPNPKKKKKSSLKDTPEETPEGNTSNMSSEVNKESSNRKKTKNTVLTEEDEVKDEDIDKFCEEITEEDNEQYENWVKLIEAQLNSNKRKPK